MYGSKLGPNANLTSDYCVVAQKTRLGSYKLALTYELEKHYWLGTSYLQRKN